MPKRYIRTSGNYEIGFGHFFRSLALIELSELGDWIMIHDGIPEFLLNTLDNYFITHLQINADRELLEIIEEKDILVIDKYNYPEDVVIALLNKNVIIYRIDDLADGIINGNYLINHAPNMSESNYNKKFNGQLLLGSEYLLIRKKLLENTKKRFCNKKETIKAIVCFGASEHKELVFNSLKILNAFDRVNAIDLVSGKQSMYKPTFNLSKKLNNYSELNSNQLKMLFLNSDLAICSCSTIALELYSNNLPLIVIKTDENQNFLFNGLKQSAGVYCIDKIDFIENSNFLEILTKWYSELPESLDRKLFEINKIKTLFHE